MYLLPRVFAAPHTANYYQFSFSLPGPRCAHGTKGYAHLIVKERGLVQFVSSQKTIYSLTFELASN
jgi:hypothetical protein